MTDADTVLDAFRAYFTGRMIPARNAESDAVIARLRTAGRSEFADLLAAHAASADRLGAALGDVDAMVAARKVADRAYARVGRYVGAHGTETVTATRSETRA